MFVSIDALLQGVTDPEEALSLIGRSVTPRGETPPNAKPLSKRIAQLHTFFMQTRNREEFREKLYAIAFGGDDGNHPITSANQAASAALAICRQEIADYNEAEHNPIHFCVRYMFAIRRDYGGDILNEIIDAFEEIY